MMNETQRAETRAKIDKVVIEHLGVDEEKLKPEADFAEDLNADSLDMVELVMAFEEEFNIEIPDDDAEKVKTLGDAHTHIIAKIDARG